LFVVTALLLGTALAATAQPVVVIDNFERASVDAIPTNWHRIEGRGTVPVTPAFNRDDEYYRVRSVGGGKVLEGYTDGKSASMVLPNGEGYDWSLERHGKLSWRWRAFELPDGAREDDKKRNDTGAAVYVTFGADWLGRPKSIKYTYSSTLPVGTTADYGTLKVVVVSSTVNGMDRWKTVTRDVAADYRALFGGDPPDRPVSVMVWSDSDTTKGRARFYLDDLVVKS
jgi:hypothetical protein